MVQSFDFKAEGVDKQILKERILGALKATEFLTPSRFSNHYSNLALHFFLLRKTRFPVNRLVTNYGENEAIRR